MKYEVIIGLEIHIQSKSKSKMFCSCDANYFQAPANTHTCPVCLGLPGALPVPNEEAIKNCIKLGLALNCKINKQTKFDRKNYFYPDLPKGFQISQYDLPIAKEGYLDVELKDRVVKIGITRVHQEEDTGKSLHENGETYLDYNKSGVPLLECVTEPDFRSKEEVNAFAKRLRQIVRYLSISNADMEKGEMRFELNISLRKQGQKELPNYKVEIKNIASISVLEKVIDFEIERQSEILDNSQIPVQETRGLLNMSGQTVSQRVKEAEAGYRYFPEPDIPLIELDDKLIDNIKSTIIELPNEKKSRYVKMGIEKEIAESIISDVDRYLEFESSTKSINSSHIVEFSKWYVTDYFSYDQSERHPKFELSWLDAIITNLNDKKITRTIAKEVFLESFKTGKQPGEIIKEKGLEVISDSDELSKVVDTIISNNPKAVEDAKKNPNAIMFIVGQVMKEMKGKADVNMIKELINSKLK